MTAKRPPQSQNTTVRDAICTWCGCLCDDLQFTVTDNQIIDARGACQMGRTRFLTYQEADGPACVIGGNDTALEDGLERAAQMLAEAVWPLVHGLRHISCEAQRAAVAVADAAGGVIDWTTGQADSVPFEALQQVGQVTATWGEVANRADLVLFWNADPLTAHPRHAERYSLEPAGMFVPRGREDRTCVVIGSARSSTSNISDLFVQISAGGDLQGLTVLRGLVAGLQVEGGHVLWQTGAPLEAWAEVAQHLKDARYAAVFYGDSLLQGPAGGAQLTALFLLIRELNLHTRAICSSLGEAGNAAGAANVLAWQTGYPLGVDFSLGYPRANGREYANESTASNADVVLSIGQAEIRLRSSANGLTSTGSEIVFRTSDLGVSAHGTVYRADDVPLTLRPPLTSRYPAPEEILTRLAGRVRALKASPGAAP